MSGQTNSHSNPYQPPVVPGEAAPDAPRTWPGVSRLGFVFLLIGALFATGVFVRLTQPWINKSALGVHLALYLPLALATVPRIRNIGRHPALALLILIPLLNFFALLPCFILPPGFETHQKFDPAAKIIFGLIILAVVGLVIFMVWAGQFAT